MKKNLIISLLFGLLLGTMTLLTLDALDHRWHPVCKAETKAFEAGLIFGTGGGVVACERITENKLSRQEGANLDQYVRDWVRTNCPAVWSNYHK